MIFKAYYPKINFQLNPTSLDAILDV